MDPLIVYKQESFEKFELLQQNIKNDATTKLMRIDYRSVAEQQEAQSARKPKKKGKLAQYEEDVIECLRQGFGEEKQLLEEAYTRKNKWARINYVKAYYRAVDRFNRGRA